MDQEPSIEINQHENNLGEIKVDWEKPPTVMDLKADFEECRESHQSHESKVDEWMDYLKVEGHAKPKKRKNRSSVQPKTIRKQAEWRYSALSEPFLSTEDLFDIKAVTWEDVDSARKNQLVLNHQFNNEMNKTQFIDEYVRTAVDEGTVFLKVGWEYEEEEYQEAVETFRYFRNEQMAPLFEEIMQLRETNPNEFFRTVPEELQTALKVFEEQGIPTEPVGTGEFEEVTKTRILKNRPTLEIQNYKNIYVDPTCEGDFDKARFVITTFTSSKAELEKDGRYSNINKIMVESNSTLGEPDHDISTDGAANYSFNDSPRKRFVVHEYHGFFNVDGSNKLIPIVAAWVGNTMIRLEEAPYPDKKLPFVKVSYLPVRREVHGEPDGSLLKENQDIIGAVTRGMIDSMARSANGQTGIRKGMLDAVNRRKYERGEDYEFNVGQEPQLSVYMHQYPDLPQAAPTMIEYQNNDAEALTGVTSFSGGLSGNAFGDVAAGIRGALDSASRRELGILRRLAYGVVEAGRKIVAMNAEFLSEEEFVRITNTSFEQIRRDELAGKFDLKLSISTAEEDNSKAEELGFMLQTLGNTVDFSIIKMVLGKYFRLRKLPDLAHQIENFQPQPDPLDQELKMLEIEKVKAEINSINAQAEENRAEAQLDLARVQSETAKAAETQSKTDLNALNFVEQESGVAQTRDLEKQQAQAEGNERLERTKFDLEQRRGASERQGELEGELLRNYLGNSSTSTSAN